MTKKKTTKKTTQPKPKKEETTVQALNRVARALNNLAKREPTLSLMELAEVFSEVSNDLMDKADDVATEMYDNVRHVAPASAVLKSRE